MGGATVMQTRHQAAGMESTTDTSVSGQTGLGNKELTFDDHILTSFLVLLALATDLIGKAITLMAKSVAMLAHRIMLHPLSMDA